MQGATTRLSVDSPMRRRSSERAALLSGLDWMRDVVRWELCHGCGTCAAACPTEAITMEILADGTFLPLVSADGCVQCGQCRSVCPANEYDPHWFDDLFPDDACHSVWTGPYLECWIGNSADAQVRYRATSGGMVTALLLHALRTGLIDGAVVVRAKRDNPFSAQATLASTEDDVLAAMGSKYVPVPINEVLRDLEKNNGKYALVGLPCHLRGLRMAQRANGHLGSAVRVVLGLVCSHTLQKHGLEYVLKKHGSNPEDVEELSFANAGWPGGLTVRSVTGSTTFIPRLKSLWTDTFGSHVFTPRYCLLCPDLTAETSDITFADAWLPNIQRTDKDGTSLLLVRTHTGQELLASAQESGDVCVKRCPSQWFVRSQAASLTFKKRQVRVLRNLRRLMGRKNPRDRTILVDPRLVDYALAVYPVVNKCIGDSRFGRWAIGILPTTVIRLPRLIYKIAMHLCSSKLKKTNCDD